MKRKLFSGLSLIISIGLIVLLASGCLTANVDPDTLNLNNKGNGVITAYVTPQDPFFGTVDKVEVGYNGEFLEGIKYSVEDNKLIVKIERKELIKILKDAGIAESVFEQYVNLGVIIYVSPVIGDDFSVLKDYNLRVINPSNAGK